MSRLDSLVCFCLRVSMGKLQNLGFSKASKQVVMSVCVAGVALREILMCLQTANVSKVVL